MSVTPLIHVFDKIKRRKFKYCRINNHSKALGKLHYNSINRLIGLHFYFGLLFGLLQ